MMAFLPNGGEASNEDKVKMLKEATDNKKIYPKQVYLKKNMKKRFYMTLGVRIDI